MALGLVAVALTAHFSGQLLAHRSGQQTGAADLATAELQSALQDLLAQSVEGKLLGFPSQRFWPDPAQADADWSGAAQYGPRWLIPAYSFGIRSRSAAPAADPGEDRQEIFKTRTAALREQRVFVAYPGLAASDRALSAGPDPSFVPPDGLQVLIMIEWVDANSTRRTSAWDENGRPSQAFDLEGLNADPLELRGGDVQRRSLATWQVTR